MQNMKLTKTLELVQIEGRNIQMPQILKQAKASFPADSSWSAGITRLSQWLSTKERCLPDVGETVDKRVKTSERLERTGLESESFCLDCVLCPLGFVHFVMESGEARK